MPSRFPRISRTLVLLAATLAPALLHGQATRSATEIPYSRVDVYAGYGYWHPINSGISGNQYQDVYNPNATVSVSGFFNRYVGVQIEGGYFSGSLQHIAAYPTCGKSFCDQLVYTAEAGPVVRWPLGRLVPFVHALGGGERVNGPVAQPLKWGWGVTGGGGIDYVLPFFHDRFAVRPIQADFQYSQVVYGPLVLPAGTSGGFGEIDALKLSGGLVARFGEVNAPKKPVMLGCTTQPDSVYAGDPVTITGSTLYTNPKKPQNYTWTTSSGRITPSGASATVDTTGLAPGDYTIMGHVAQGKRVTEQANCTAPFTVKSNEPPTITCMATPATVASGAVVDITSSGMSPQNRPLTYSYSASAGLITGAGATAKLNTTGVAASTVTVTCNLVDDLGKTATTTTTVTVQAPPVPVVAESKALCSVAFTRDTRRPVRVDNEAKACLDEIALTMNQATDAKLELIGNASPDEKPEAAAQRALNVRAYLTQEKGLDKNRIEVRVGDTSGRTLRTSLVPAGAIFPDAGTQTFDEAAIPGSGQAYGTGHGTAATTVKRTPAKRKRRRRTGPATSSAVGAGNVVTTPAPVPTPGPQ